MYNLKDNNPTNYKVFSEGNLNIRYAMVENGQDWHPIHLVVKQVIMRFLEINGAQKPVPELQVLKKLREEYDFSPCLLAQLLSSNN